MGAIFGCVANARVRVRRIGFRLGGRTVPPIPLFLVSADSKEVAGDMSVSADSAGVKVAEFSVS
jgi:hypothetical protein